MAEHEKLVAGSPFTGSTTLDITAAITTARLVAIGGGCTVTLSDGTADIYTLDALPGEPDEYHGTANRKLPFSTNVGIAFTGGGKLYLYYT